MSPLECRFLLTRVSNLVSFKFFAPFEFYFDVLRFLRSAAGNIIMLMQHMYFCSYNNELDVEFKCLETFFLLFITNFTHIFIQHSMT